MDRKITLPLTDEDARSLRAGDYVYLSGVIYTARDAAHKRMYEALENGESLPIEMKNNVVYYLGPTPARPGHVIGSAGPTTTPSCSAAVSAGAPDERLDFSTGLVILLCSRSAVLSFTLRPAFSPTLTSSPSSTFPSLPHQSSPQSACTSERCAPPAPPRHAGTAHLDQASVLAGLSLPLPSPSHAASATLVSLLS